MIFLSIQICKEKVVFETGIAVILDIRKPKSIEKDEMEAFIGLLIIMGAFHARYRDIDELWSLRDGIAVCRATMSVERFLQIKSAIRFDDPLRRNKGDRLAPVRQLLQNFNQKLRQVYTTSEWLTVDEQLLEFHGRVARKTNGRTRKDTECFTAVMGRFWYLFGIKELILFS